MTGLDGILMNEADWNEPDLFRIARTEVIPVPEPVRAGTLAAGGALLWLLRRRRSGDRPAELRPVG